MLGILKILSPKLLVNDSWLNHGLPLKKYGLRRRPDN